MSSSSDDSKKILLGITGGIAAYKSVYLVREFVKKGWEVKVIMTESAKDFVGPLSFSTLSKNPVYSQMFDPGSGEWTNHVDLGKWADVFVIAPATANSLAKAANGICDNLLLAAYLSCPAPILWAPAMDLDMYGHQSTKDNLALLKKRGDQVIDAGSGELASGLQGQGRMAEPEEILKRVEQIMRRQSGGKKKSKKPRVLVTAGPTYEAIDPVRFIGNRSSGKMGFAIARSLSEAGFAVDLVSGPTSLNINDPNINVVQVESADEMEKAAKRSFKNSIGAVLAAAVADYKPRSYFTQKKKKINRKPLDLELVETKDIALSLKKLKSKGQFTVGFALETENELRNAKSKLERKGFDMIVLNSLNDQGAGFQVDTNKVTLIFSGRKKPRDIELKSKEAVSKDIVDEIKNLI